MATILVIQHDSAQHPGRLGATLRDHGFRLDVRRPDLDDGACLPGDLDNIHGVVSLGGLQNPDDAHAWLSRERDILRASTEAGLPTVGICLGHQLLAQALGGEVARMDAPEVGFPEIEMTAAGRDDTILSGVAWKSRQFSSHAYEVTTPPPGAAVLASSESCKVQAFRSGHRAYGFQFHLEADRAIAESIIGAGPAAEADDGVAGANAQLDEHYPSFARFGDRISVNLATLAFPFDALTAV